MTDESTLATQPAREAQEPVAWRISPPADDHYGTGSDTLSFFALSDDDLKAGYTQQALYATPPDAAATIERLTGLLGRCRTVLGNMARENEGATFFRWPINHEPLRADAKNLLPLIDEEIGYDA